MRGPDSIWTDWLILYKEGLIILHLNEEYSLRAWSEKSRTELKLSVTLVFSRFMCEHIATSGHLTEASDLRSIPWRTRKPCWFVLPSFVLLRSLGIRPVWLLPKTGVQLWTLTTIRQFFTHPHTPQNRPLENINHNGWRGRLRVRSWAMWTSVHLGSHHQQASGIPLEIWLTG